MDLEAAEIELYLRKYQWALTNFMREAEEDYPFLRSLTDPAIQRFLAYLPRFSAAEQQELATLIVKGANRPALQLLGETFTREDETRVKQFSSELRVTPLGNPTLGISSEPITKVFAVKRTDTAKIALSFLSAAFGSKPEKFDSLQWFYTAPLGDWRLQTDLDFSGTWGTEIRCNHRLIRNDSKSCGFLMMSLSSAAGIIRVPQDFSLLKLYCISSGIYYIGSIEGVHSAAQTILDCYNRLFQTVPEWIDGLTIN